MSILVHMFVSVDIVYISPYLCICPYLLICLYLQLEILFISVNMHRIQSHRVRSPSHHAPSPNSESLCTISMHHLQFLSHVHICAYVIYIHSYLSISDQYQCMYVDIYKCMCISVYMSVSTHMYISVHIVYI